MKTLFRILLILTISFLFFSFFNPHKEETSKIEPSIEFLNFLNSIPQKGLPYITDLECLGKNPHPRIVEKVRNYPGIENYIPAVKASKFSRIGSPIITPYQYFKVRDDIYAVIYSSKNFFSHQYWELFCITLDNNGKVLGEEFLGHFKNQEIVISSIDKNGIIERTTYENTWIWGFEKYCFGNNEIYKRRKKEITFLKINEKGMFEELKTYPTTLRASLY